ncbi:ComEC/Rec2 family competence protein [Atopobiaceae bacterium 24-176]
MSDWPERPQVPLAFSVFLACAVALRVQLPFGWVPSPLEALSIGLGCAVALFVVCAKARRFLRPMLVFMAAMALAVASGAWAMGALARAERELAQTPVSQLSLTTVTDPSQGAYGWSCEARASLDGRVLGTVRLLSDEGVPLRQTLSGIGSFSVPDEGRAAEYRCRGLAGTVRLRRVVRDGWEPGALGALASVRERLLLAFDPDVTDAHGVIAALALGWRGSLRSSGVADLVSKAGVSHLVAVSGAHLAVVAGLLGKAAARGRSLSARTLVMGALTGVFVLLCATPASAARAWAMALAASMSGVAGRRSSPLAALGCFGWLFCVLDPSIVFDLGFTLSCLCVAALCLFGPWARAAVDGLLPGPPARRRDRPLAKAAAALRRRCVPDLSAGLVCFVASAPAAASSFGSLSLAGPLCSMVCAPFFPLLLTSALAAVLFSCVPVVGVLADWAATAAALLFIVACRCASAFPWAVLPVEASEGPALAAALLCACLFLALWPRPQKARLRRAVVVGAVALLVAGAVPWFSPPSLEVLDVGQGDAVLLRDGPASILVDCGPAGAGLPSLLRARGVLSLDAVVLTHQHDDHYGGLGELAGSVAVGKVMVAQGVEGALCDDVASAVDALGAEVCPLSAGDSLCAGRWRLEDVWPQGTVDGTENAQSLCLVAAHGLGLRALLTGDAEKDELSRFAGDVGHVDVLKLGHHGSAASVDEVCIEALVPVACVASAGENNSYGHPDPACVSTVTGSGARFFCTASAGSVRFDADTSAGLRATLGKGLAAAA